MRTRAQEAFEDVRLGAGRVVRLIERAPRGAVPAFDYLTGAYRLDPEYRPDAWGAFQWTGFLAGRLWLTAEHFGDDRIRDAAHKLACVVAGTLRQRPPRFSAAGSDLFYAACLGARVTGDAGLKAAALAATRQYAVNFDTKFGVFFQVPGVNRAVIDTGLNLLPFYWCAREDPPLAALAERHNETLLRAGIMREDGSAHQAIEFDQGTAQVRLRYNMQGYGNDTTWARGQSWAIHNYVNAYEATGRADFLRAGRAAARWYRDHLPAGHVPFYDFADPQAPAVPRDSCSAAIAANALLKLGQLDPSCAGWATGTGREILKALLEHYLSPGGVLLHSSWGRLPAEKAGAGISRFPLEDIMPYGNYWIVEALFRTLHPDWHLLALG
jgi:unsaturated chondroitin disaccharide hydrolase